SAFSSASSTGWFLGKAFECPRLLYASARQRIIRGAASMAKLSLKIIPSPPRRCKQLHHPQAPQRQEGRDSRGNIFQIPEANMTACPERSKPRAHVKGADSTFRCRSPDSPSIF